MNVFAGVDDVARELGLSPSTIKKYYLLIEENGYRFTRSRTGKVIFSERDLEIFKRLIQIKNEKGIKVVDAVKTVISSITDVTVWKESAVATEFEEPPVDITVMKETMEQMHEIIKNQQKQIDQLLESQNQTQKLLESGSTDRDKLLLQSIRETQELKQLILENNKKKKWWQFGK
ncbi:DUF3967 domain-containing protein (plasmid) [Bacillus sp. SA116]|uniref:HTH DNA-binding protein n=1 Tax=Bacillus subtilis subsp. subtilis NCIB 3610 = ATCC 6051 = DSM 10 TaxID=535026 RepID=S5DQ32_BACIU|nr:MULTISPECIES: DUF3967 domain-containing protein [Bacillus]AGQ21303.1 HTH DNA-binding protein [Bacillus subtilis subsp. subtilis NCIB 3610 = ATCC 6051 = DSM 10]AQZ93213.1 hypothetical protein B4U62_22430 [Bacillus subtilis]KAA0930070.1 DUF3967 domain-containing protein [Bacillus sp. ANT_WA51]KNB75904.1 hypothetical protein ACR57_20935 [Bacillus subtilis]MBA4562874.1 DUF3967 domain-containing protein [Bacillus subtilis subsp. subtilis]